MIRVAITSDRFDVVSRHFTSSGLDPVPTACVRVEPEPEAALDEARTAAARATLLVVTSARTIDLLWPGRAMPEVDVIAVGEATAAAVSSAGGRLVGTGDGGLEELVAGHADLLASPIVVFPHGVGSSTAGLTRLRSICPGVEEHLIYRTVSIAPPQVPVDAVAFASPSAVSGWMLSRDLEDVVVATIGKTTAAAVARFRAPDLVAPEPSFRSLARVLSGHFEVKV